MMPVLGEDQNMENKKEGRAFNCIDNHERS